MMSAIFTARVIEEFEFTPGGWRGCRVGIFRNEGNDEEQIGQYERNYGAFFNTFFHFRQNEKDLALYSPHYTVTRIMELPSCRDIGGEEINEMGFCPVDYLVPTYIDQENTFDFGTDSARTYRKRLNNPRKIDLTEREERHKWIDHTTNENKSSVSVYRPLTPLLYYEFGFVAGCIWGDDSSWKIQYLDLSEATNGIVKRDERFGYIMLPANQSLKEAIDMYDYAYDPEDAVAHHIRINIMQTFDLRTGKSPDPFA